MHTATSGQINVTPIDISTTLTLQHIGQQLKAEKYSRDGNRRGWGGVSLVADGVIEREPSALRDQPGEPRILTQQGRGPMLAARLMYDFIATATRRRYPDLVKSGSEQAFTLDAVDVYIRSIKSGGYGALICSRDPTQVEHTVIPAIENSIRSQDGGATVSTSPNHLTPERDLFLWLIAKNGSSLGKKLSLSWIREMRMLDGHSQRAELMDSVDLDRDLVQICVKDPANSFGPGKFVLTDLAIDLEVDIELTLDGSFSLHVTRSEFLSPNAPELNSPKGRVLALRAVADDLLPKLYELHHKDSKWHQGGRDALRDKCRKKLLKGI